MKIAIVHEWFDNYAGSERVVESFTNIWLVADVFTHVDILTGFKDNPLDYIAACDLYLSTSR